MGNDLSGSLRASFNVSVPPRLELTRFSMPSSEPSTSVSDVAPPAPMISIACSNEFDSLSR